MATCGMYDCAGEWMYRSACRPRAAWRAGSSPSLPGQLGIGVFSPPLDRAGQQRARHARLPRHRSGARPPPRRAVDRRQALATAPRLHPRAGRLKAEAQRRGPEGPGAERRDGRSSSSWRASVSFLAVESLAAIHAAAAVKWARSTTLVLELRCVERNRPTGYLYSWPRSLDQRHRRRGDIIASGDNPAPSGGWKASRDLGGGAPTEAGESEQRPGVRERVLRGSPLIDVAVAATAHPVLAGLSEADRRAVVAAPRSGPTRPARTSSVPATLSSDVFLVLAGRLSVTIHVDGEGPRRLSTLEAGMVFGEPPCWAPAGGVPTSALTGRSPACAPTAAFDALANERPAAAVAILRNLLETATATMARLTREMTILVGSAAVFSLWAFEALRRPRLAAERRGLRGSRGRSRPGSACAAGSCPRR